jgi:hypothetical protein
MHFACARIFHAFVVTIRRSAMSQINRIPALRDATRQRGGIGYVLLWLLGVPIPLLILFALLRGCA